jgi:hypothetical protein
MTQGLDHRRFRIAVEIKSVSSGGRRAAFMGRGHLSSKGAVEKCAFSRLAAIARIF